MKERVKELLEQTVTLLDKAREDDDLDTAIKEHVITHLEKAFYYFEDLNLRMDNPIYKPVDDDYYKFSRGCWQVGAAQGRVFTAKQR